MGIIHYKVLDDNRISRQHSIHKDTL